jgi:hypothetical protein
VSGRTSDMTRTLVAIAFGTCLLLAAAESKQDEPKQKVQITSTEHMDLPANGTVRLNSTGDLTIEGWDQPGVEITTVKSTKTEVAAAEREKASHGLDLVKASAKRQGDELVITTNLPRHAFPPPPPPFLRGVTRFDLECHVKVPRNARLIVDHDVGEVYFDDVRGDIRATLLQGDITLHLPQEGQYAIDAKSDFGSVTSDFPGNAKGRFWLVGHQFTQTSAAPHKLYLRAGFGDIIILKIRKPSPLPPLNQ